MTAIGPFSIDTYLPAFKDLVVQLHAPEAQIQWSIGVFFLGFAFGQLFYGSLSDRIGRTLPLYAGLALYILGAIGCALSTTGWQLIAFRLIQALGGCAQMVISRAVVRDRFPPHEAAGFYSMMMLVSGLAPIVAPLLGGWLLVNFGWRSIFWFMASFAGVILASVLLTLEESHPPERRIKLSLPALTWSYASLLRDRTFMSYTMGAAIYSGCLFAYISASPFIYMGIYHVRPEHYGLYFAVNSIGIMTAGQLNRLLLRHFTVNQILSTAFRIELLGSIAVALQTLTGYGGFVALLIPLFVIVALFGTIMPMTTALAMAGHGEKAGNASAMLGMLQFLWSGMVGILIGILNDGTARPMGILILLCGIGGFLINRFATRDRPLHPA